MRFFYCIHPRYCKTWVHYHASVVTAQEVLPDAPQDPVLQRKTTGWLMSWTQRSCAGNEKLPRVFHHSAEVVEKNALFGRSC